MTNIYTPKQTTQALITGAIASSGSFENKKGEQVKYDSINFYVQMPLTKGKGFATVENKLRNRSHDFDKIFGAVELPAMAEISFVEQTDGKGNMVREVVDVVIIKPAKVNNG